MKKSIAPHRPSVLATAAAQLVFNGWRPDMDPVHDLRCQAH